MVNEEVVMNALMNVVDPDIGIDVVSLGLIYEVKIKEGDVFVLFTLTFPGCPYADFLVEEIKENVSSISGVKNVEVKVTFSPPWSPDKIDPDVRAALNL